MLKYSEMRPPICPPRKIVKLHPIRLNDESVNAIVSSFFNDMIIAITEIII